MTSLEHFNAKIRSAAVGSGYKVSGVALVETQGQNFYSVSLVSIDPKISKPDLKSVNSKFQKMRVDGFVFLKCEILTFLSDLSLPKPGWRVQIKYIL